MYFRNIELCNKILSIWKKASIITKFNLKVSSNDDFPEHYLRTLEKMMISLKAPPSKLPHGFYLTSKCDNRLLWSAPEFVVKTIIYTISKPDMEGQMVFKIDHVHEKTIDRGIKLENVEVIFDSFIKKFPASLNLTSLHIKLLSWMNLNDMVLRKTCGLLQRHWKTVSDLQLIYSGYEIKNKLLP